MPLHHMLGDEFKGIAVDDVRVLWGEDYCFYGMQPPNEMRSSLLKLRGTDTRGPILQSDKVPSTISMDENHPLVKMYHLPLAERCRNYSPFHCQQALERYGANTSCSGNHGLREDTLDFTNDGDENDFEMEAMCDDLPFPSPLKKQKPGKMQAYEHFKPLFDEFVGIMGDSAAGSQIFSQLTGVFNKMIMQARTDLAAHLPKPTGRIVSSAAPTSKRTKTHGTQHYSKRKRK